MLVRWMNMRPKCSKPPVATIAFTSRKPCCHVRTTVARIRRLERPSLSRRHMKLPHALAARRCRLAALAPAALAPSRPSPASSTTKPPTCAAPSCSSMAPASATRRCSRSTPPASTSRKKCRQHRGGAGRARRQAHVHHHAARHRRQRAGQALHRAAWRTTGQGGVLQADPRPAAHEPDLLRPQEAQAGRHLHHRLDARHGHA